jgi:tRNA-Thr(GGU) m(6)t(6)A37 methyltransferase TsaA
MHIELKPIGFVRTDSVHIPRHYSVSDVEGDIHIEETLVEGLRDIKAGQDIVVLFYFHQSQDFSADFLIQKPPHRNEERGVFSICSPIRPNPIGMSVLRVLKITGNILRVKGIDMRDGTPILDIKPHFDE